MTYEYTGGREGTHSITMTKPIGGGVSDVQHVPLDQIELYASNGYFALDSTGTYPYTGYCMAQPLTVENPDAAQCEPAEVTPVLYAQTESATTMPPVPLPTHLPAVGSSNFGILVILGVVIVLAALVAHFNKR